ncbi:MAG: DUF5668 domain-containing protein [Atribacterota bacterium]|nr:DUF5668 domain-containing protein [Atribacterota bacterium]
MNGTQILKGLAIALVGIILLLNNLNILNWSVWYNIFRLWPLLLISLGISLIFRKRLSWLAPLVILFGIIIGASAGYLGVELHLEGKITTETEMLQREIEMVMVSKEVIPEDIGEGISEEELTESSATAEEEMQEAMIEMTEGSKQEETEVISKIQKANIHINYDIAVFELEFPTPYLYQCQTTYRYPEFKPVEEYSTTDSEASIHIYHNPLSASNKQFRNPKNKIDLKLNKDVTYDIFIETGATTIDYDLSKFKVKQFSVKSGASDIKIIAQQYNGNININSGVSKIDIAIPKNVGITLSLDTGLSMKDLDKDLRELEDNTFISNNYSDSEYQLHINIDSGLSQIKIYYI